MPYDLRFENRHVYKDDPQQAIFVPIGLSANGSYVEVAAKLDTGADFCVFDRRWAEWLNIELESGPRRTFRGLAGRFDAFEHEVTITCFGVDFTSLVYFTGELSMPRDLLGRNGWLDRLRIAIVHYDREIFLTPYDS